MENVYSYTWKGKRTGWEYKLVFKKSSDQPITDINEIKLPRGSVGLKSTNWQFDKYPIGLQSAKELEATINLELLDGTIYNDFVAMLYNPITEIDLRLGFQSYPRIYYLGTIIEFYIKFNNNAEPSINDFRLQDIYIIRDDQEVEYNRQEKIFNINATDINRAIFNQLKPEDLLILVASSNKVEKTGYVELFQWATNSLALFNVPTYYFNGKNYKMTFVPFSDFIATIEFCCQEIYRKMVRNTTVNYDVAISTPKIYKQLYDGTGALGNQISASNLYILVKIDDGTNAVGGLFDSRDEDSLTSNFNTLNDLLNDLFTTFIQKAFITSGSLNSTGIFSSHVSETIVTIDVNKVELTFKQMSGLCKKVTASMYESKQGATSDIDNFKAEISDTRNSNEFTIPVLFNTMPSQAKFESYSISRAAGNEDMKSWIDGCIIIAPGIISSALSVSNENRRFGLYYLDDTAFTNQSEIFKCHSFIDFLIKDGFYSSQLIPFEAKDTTSYNGSQMSALVAYLQSYSSPQLAADILLKLLSNKNQHIANLKTKIEYITDIKAGGSVGYVWDNPNIIIDLDLNQIDTRKIMINTKWHVVSSKIDYDEEIAELELLLRTV